MIDCHVHLAALPTPENHCLLSKRMLNSLVFKISAYQQGLPLDNPALANRKYVETLEQELSTSEFIHQAVILGIDGVYDTRGKLDESQTEFLISNDYVFQVASEHPSFLPGVSIHPNRSDALEELTRCVEKGAVLLKVLPNTQGFDPSAKRFRPFYRAMAEHRLPLLSHVGYEFTLSGTDQSLGDPEKLIPALEEGVTVIAAHGCSYGLFFYERYFKTMLNLVRQYKHFYIDTSALTLPNRVLALMKIRKHPELFERLLFGTDYPLPCFAYPTLLGASFSGYRRARSTTNRFDRHFQVIKSLGIKLGAGSNLLQRKNQKKGKD